MPTSPAVVSAVACLCESLNPFSERSISALFRACITAADIEWESPRSLDLYEELWYSDSVLSAVEALKEAHEANRETGPARRRLLETIDAELQELA